jgi:hypothetical protein
MLYEWVLDAIYQFLWQFKVQCNLRLHEVLSLNFKIGDSLSQLESLDERAVFIFELVADIFQLEIFL